MRVKLPSRLETLSILLAVLLSGCQPAPVALPALSATPTSSPQRGKHVSLVVGMDAPAFLKREGWKDYQPAGFGTVVYSIDLLKTEGKISLFCVGSQTVETFTGIDRNPCPLPATGSFLIYDGMLLDSSTRAAPANSIPYILYPRATAILESHPVLRWNDTGASSYTVEIWQGSRLIWQQANATRDRVSYPADAPALLPATNYLLVVTDNDTKKSSRSDPNKDLGFRVVGADRRAQIEAQQKAILRLTSLHPAAQKLVLGLYFDQVSIDGRGLWGGAAVFFEEVLKAQTNAPAVHLYLGVSLAKMKLWSEAKTEYEAALKQAGALNDLESQAAALAALWRITGDETMHEQAVKLYEELGAQGQAEVLKKEHSP